MAYLLSFISMFSLTLKDLNIFVLILYGDTAWRYSNVVMTSYHRKCVQILSGGKSRERSDVKAHVDQFDFRL